MTTQNKDDMLFVAITIAAILCYYSLSKSLNKKTEAFIGDTSTRMMTNQSAPAPISSGEKIQSYKNRQPARRTSNSWDGDDSSIRGTDNGYKWNKTAYAAKISICKDLARRIGRRDTQFYYGCLEEMYDTTDPMLLELTIAFVAGMCSVW